VTLGEFLTLCGYLTGFCVFLWATHKEGFDREAMGKLLAVGFFSGVVGARIAQHLLGGGSFATLLSTQQGGRTVIAGLLCGWFGVEVAKRVMGLRRSTGAAFALAMCAGEAIGRIGCHFNGCCFGREWSGSLAVVQQGTERFPSQLLSAAYAACVFGVLLRFWKKVSSAGLFRLYLALFVAGRFVIEFTREPSTLYAGLSLAQWVCAEIGVGLVVTHVWMHRREMKEKTT
jgi:phosphatidylglycerol:prolipoprotein diacylglycerol transferase